MSLISWAAGSTSQKKQFRHQGSYGGTKARKLRNRFLSTVMITCCSVSAVAVTLGNAPAEANTKRDSEQSTRFDSLVQKFQDVPLEKGDTRFIRFNAYSPQGKEAIRQYRIAVEIMKNKPASDPYSWAVQSGIHGTFWTTIQSLKEGMINKGYFNDPKTDEGLTPKQVRAAAEVRAERAFSSWNVIINNCNHWAQLWSDAQGTNSADTTPNFSVVFQAWHRLYLSAFEKNVRQVLIDEKQNRNSKYRQALANANVQNWSLPYWDYRNPKTGSIPKEFRNSTTENGEPNSLYEPIRSVMVNNGVSVQNIPMPDQDLGLLSAKELPGKRPESGKYTVGDFYNASVVLQQSQTSFASFNSLSELAPHAVGHDIIGGLADTQESKLDLWLAMVDLARSDNLSNFWSSDESPKELQAYLKGQTLYDFAKEPKNRVIFLSDIAPTAIPSVFGPNPTIGPTIIGWVPTAARDPVFWLHHAYVDKMWSEYNTMRTGAFLDEGTLANSGWNFTFWEPGPNGKPVLKTFSTWKNATYLPDSQSNITPSKVLERAYYPTYTYDYIQPLDINLRPISAKPNKLLALLESPNLSPILSQITNQTKGSGLADPLSELVFRPIDLDLPISAGTIDRIGSNQSDVDDIRVSVEINVEVPMSSSENIGIIVGDLNFLRTNAEQIRNYWNSWTYGAGLGARDGDFVPSSDLMLKGLDGRMITGDRAKTLLGKMSLARFNPLAMSNHKAGMKGHGMTTHYSTELTPAIANQFELAAGEAITQSSPVGIMLLTSRPNSRESTNTFIKKISTSLHQNLKSSNSSDGFDAMQFIAENPSLLNNEDAVADLEVWYENNKTNSQEKPTYLSRALRLAYIYLASNPDLIKRYRDTPLAGLDHYLSQGLQQGRSLDSWTRTASADTNGTKSIEDQARIYVLTYQ